MSLDNIHAVNRPRNKEFKTDLTVSIVESKVCQNSLPLVGQ